MEGTDDGSAEPEDPRELSSPKLGPAECFQSVGPRTR